MVRPLVRTVLGDVPATALGRCDYHEHLFQTSPLLPGDELDDETASGAEAVSLHRAGIGAMVEATPTGLGRDPAAVARISAATGLVVVHVTGAHRSEHYREGHRLTGLSEAALAARFAADVRDGLPAAEGATDGPVATAPDGAPVRAGMVKAGVGYWRIDAFERRVLAAGAATANATGVAMMVHLEHGSAAWEVLDVLAAAGLSAERVVLAHADRNLDPGLHAELTRAGAYLGYDGMARHREAPDAAILDCLEQVLTRGDPRRLLLGGDVARRSRYRAYGGIPGLDYLPVRFLPRVRQRVGDDVLDLLLVTNPARVLTLT
ncbi:phosphotriesterase [Pseudonocardia sp. MH-G8]|uniref:phosphotriesterase family protein n=1 Tax=Pseudonocardia sp. MH-G8 TaxID=1854588 RepID=UPI000BA06079|nr:aryldialkylphosphatase [Pseudonocardia sp. MH-G8]OZM77557.1 aryldialkylphosphatase [Pseudonocardia sp. MH-G8]